MKQHTALCGSASIANVTSQDEATWAGEGSYLEVAAMHDAHLFIFLVSIEHTAFAVGQHQ